MIQTLTKLYEGGNLSGAVPGVIYMPILDSRTLNVIKVKTDENVAGADAVLQLKKNGTVITGAGAITIAVGAKIGTVPGLSVALAEGDELLLDLLSGALSSPVTLSIQTAKTVGTDEITEVTDKKYVTDAEKTKLANTSNVNSGDQILSDATISTSDITTGNATTAKHGFLKKLDNDPTHFLNGQGNWTAPAGGGGGSTVTGYDVFDVDAPYASPSSYDDDFSGGGSLDAKWVSFGASLTSSGISSNPTFLKLVPNINQLGGFMQTIAAPTTSAKWRGKVKLEPIMGGSYQFGGMVCQQNGSGNLYEFSIYCVSGTYGGQINSWTAFDTYGSTIGSWTPSADGKGEVWMEIEYNSGTGLTWFRYSLDGYYFRDLTSISMAIQKVGFYARNTPQKEVIFDWFRKVDGSGRTGIVVKKVLTVT